MISVGIQEPLQSREQFVAGRREAERQTGYAVAIMLVLMLLPFLPVRLFIGSAGWNEARALPWALLVGGSFMAYVLVLAAGLDRWNRKVLRRLRQVCPACERLFARHSGEIVVATGRCGACGAEVLSKDHGQS